MPADRGPVTPHQGAGQCLEIRVAQGRSHGFHDQGLECFLRIPDTTGLHQEHRLGGQDVGQVCGHRSCGMVEGLVGRLDLPGCAAQFQRKLACSGGSDRVALDGGPDSLPLDLFHLQRRKRCQRVP